MMTRRHFLAASAAGLAFAATGPAPRGLAQSIGKPTRILVGYPPGGTTDVIARLLANEMKTYAPSTIVENRPGAAGHVALAALKSSPADGSVLIVAPESEMSLAPHVYKTLPYDPARDFIPVTTVCGLPLTLTIGPKVPAEVQTLSDFISWCRANPGQATYGSPGAGTPLHFTGVQLARAAGIAFAHVPYQGAAPAVQDLLGGQIASTLLPIDGTLPHVQSGTLRVLTTSGPQRSIFLPDVPTFREAGYPTLETIILWGIFVPANTPAGIVDKLNDTIRKTLKTNEVSAGLARLSAEIVEISRGDFAGLIKSESERWSPIVRASGFTPRD
jgi:tripartite-type tricarboxylate transporter receptor subunit TctC